MLRVPNVGAAVKYYCDVLGMKLIKEQKGAAALRFAWARAKSFFMTIPICRRERFITWLKMCESCLSGERS